MSTSIPLASDARERFLLDIAAVVPPERVAEIHFFPPMRQGQIEAGIAVIAALPLGATSLDATDLDLVEGAAISARHVVYSARYRWTRKGPDRGKWESEIVAEADAPLLTVDAVVQGVRARADGPVDVERVEGAAARAMIAGAQRWCQTTP